MALTLNLANKIINGNFEIWQRGTTFAAAANAIYTTDRFSYQKLGSVVNTVLRSTDVPLTTKSIYSLQVNTTTAMPSPGIGDYVGITTKLEGLAFRPLLGKKLVLQFWVKSTKVGKYTVSIRNGAFNRSYMAEYSVFASNTWELKTIRLAHDPSGTWAVDNTTGIQFFWALAAGSNHVGPDNTWTSGNNLKLAAQVNAVDSTANVFKIAEVMLVEDNDGLSRVPEYTFAGRDAIEEIQMCQRYFEKSYNLDVNPGTITAVGEYIGRSISTTTRHQIEFISYKRANSVMSYYNPVTGALGTWRDVTVPANVATSSAQIGQGSFAAFLTVSAGGNLIEGHWTADAEL